MKLNQIRSNINDYLVTFQNSNIATSNLVMYMNQQLVGKLKTEYYSSLLLYIKQFYSDNEFLKDINDVASLVKLFYRCHSKVESLSNRYMATLDPKSIKEEIETLNKILEFYKIIEEFTIRSYDYSIIGKSNQKVIITSHNDCDKVFIDYLMQGYSLIRLQKLYLVKDNDNKQAHFEFVPSLPTRDIGIPIEEYIETLEDNNIKSKRLIRV